MRANELDLFCAQITVAIKKYDASRHRVTIDFSSAGGLNTKY